MTMQTVATPRFDFEATSLAGVWLVQRKPIGDARGFFARLYCAEEFRAIGVQVALSQLNNRELPRRPHLRRGGRPSARLADVPAVVRHRTVGR
jgi:hypothetical protein